MGKQKFLEKVKTETGATLTKVFNKMEKFSKVSSEKLKIINLEGKIKNKKMDIGSYVVSNEKKFSEYPELLSFLKSIIEYKDRILDIEEKINEIRKQEQE